LASKAKYAGLCSCLTLGLSIVVPARQVNLTACGVLDRAGANYVLQNDVTSDSTCFSVQADNITLDLNGHTVTYGNGPVVAVPNGSFEEGNGASPAGWDLRQAPNAARVQGTFIPPTVFTGSYSLAVHLPCPDQIVSSGAPFTLPGNRTFVISAMIYNQVDDGIDYWIELDDAQTGAVLARNDLKGRTWRGFSFLATRYRTKSATPAVIRLGVRGVGLSKPGVIYLDDVTARISESHGVVAAACWAPGIGQNPCGGSARNLTVENGSIVEGAGAGSMNDGIRFYQINKSDGLEVYNTKIAVHGPSSINIQTQYQLGVTIHNNELKNDVRVVENRDNLQGMLVKVLMNPAAAGHTRIFNNVLRGGAQGGILVSGTGGEVFGNDISQDGRYSNDFSIYAYGSEFNIYGNVIHPISGRGIMVTGARNQVHDNRIEVRELAQNQEYGGCQMSGSYGIELRLPTPRNNEIYRNQITAYAEQCDSRGLGLRELTENAGNWIYENTIRAVCVGNTRAHAYGVTLVSSRGGVLLERNKVIADSANILWPYDGGYGTFVRNTFIKGSNPSPDYATFAFVNSKSAAGNLIADSTFRAGADRMSISMKPVGTGGWVGDSELQFGRTVNLRVINSHEQPVPNAHVVVLDPNGRTLFLSDTDQAGAAQVITPQCVVHNSRDPQPVVEPISPRITVSKDGYQSASSDVRSDEATRITVTLPQKTGSST